MEEFIVEQTEKSITWDYNIIEQQVTLQKQDLSLRL